MSIKQQLGLVLQEIKTTGRLDVDMLNSLAESERELIKKLYHEGLIEESLNFLDDLDIDQDWENIRQKMVSSKKPIVPLWKSGLKYAAIFIGLFALFYFLQTERQPSNDIQVAEETILLKVGKDEVKIIHQGQDQQIISAEGKVLGQQKGNMIRYSADSKVDDLVFNELVIPNGKIFDVELSDGTMVHLNSGTKMKFPVKFLEGKKREVFIDGEAYFKVAKDKDHPFVVNVNAVAIEVLGTEFNISSYKEDSEIRAVLVEGSIRMSNSFVANSEVVLKPGNKGAWDKKAHSTKVEKVDVNLYTSWVDGELIFRDSSFENMIKKLERKYNVIIENNNLSLGGKIFNASFNVNIESIDDVLKSISEIHPFSYRISDGKVEIN